MKFYLRSPHYANDALIPAEREVGDGTAYSWRDAEGNPLPPSAEMEGLDDEGREMVSAYRSAKGLPPIRPPAPQYADVIPVAKAPAAHLEIRKLKAR